MTSPWDPPVWVQGPTLAMALPTGALPVVLGRSPAVGPVGAQRVAPKGLLPSPPLICCSVRTPKPVKLPGSLGSQTQAAFEAAPGPPGFPVRGWVVALSSPRTSSSQSQSYSYEENPVWFLKAAIPDPNLPKKAANQTVLPFQHIPLKDWDTWVGGEAICHSPQGAGD